MFSQYTHELEKMQGLSLADIHIPFWMRLQATLGLYNHWFGVVSIHLLFLMLSGFSNTVYL